MSPFTIIFQHQDFLIIDKPCNTSFHSQTDSLGVAASLQHQVGIELWPVHRLDKITSGILVFAKNKIAANHFNLLFSSQQVHKIYLAISDKSPKKKQGKIIGDMQKTRNGNWKLSSQKNNPAITTFFSCSLIPGKRLYWIMPQTGKTHQIRVALKSISAAILGDTRYAGTPADRGYLHAYAIQFNWHNELIEAHCPPTDGEYFKSTELATCLTQLTEKSSLSRMGIHLQAPATN